MAKEENENEVVHIVNNETGFCIQCNDICRNKENLQKLAEIGPNEAFSINSSLQFLVDPKQSIESKLSPPTTSSSNSSVSNNKSKVMKYKRQQCCDCCKGRLAKKFKTCRFFEALYYVPTWCMLSMLLTYMGILGGIVYLVYSIVTVKSLPTYGLSCDENRPCDGDKGLYCRLENSTTTQDYCNCPGLSVVNMCDCPSSYYWNGIKCVSVYDYKSGPCAGDYTCGKGLTCDQYTGLCSCPSTKPSWSSIDRKCNYQYMGCFNFTFNVYPQTSFDIVDNDFVLQGQGSTNQLELDDCLFLCSYDKKSYTHMVWTNASRCACSNSYNNYSTKVDDLWCRMPCGLINGYSVNNCPYPGFYSSFLISS